MYVRVYVCTYIVHTCTHGDCKTIIVSCYTAFVPVVVFDILAITLCFCVFMGSSIEAHVVI